MSTHADLVINENQAESASQVLWRAVAYITAITDPTTESPAPDPEDFTLSDLRRIAANLALDPTADSQLFTVDRPQPTFWHVYGALYEFTRDGEPFIDFTFMTYGPTYMPGNSDVRTQGYPFQGTTFPYLATFDHEPTDAERQALRP